MATSSIGTFDSHLFDVNDITAAINIQFLIYRSCIHNANKLFRVKFLANIKLIENLISID